MSHQVHELTNIFSPKANIVQQVVGTFLYYARAFEPIIIVALNCIVEEQFNNTLETEKVVTRLLNYAATHSESITRYHKSRMVLFIHSDVFFL